MADRRVAPDHHPSDERLLEYASGAAPEPIALLVATHLALCPACRHVTAELEAVGGALLETLPPKDRLVLTLFYFEGWDMGEIAERVGWSRTLVKVRAHRARRKLRALLEEEGFSASGSTPDALGEVAT